MLPYFMGTPYFYTYDFVYSTYKMQPSLHLRSEKLFYNLHAVTVIAIAPSSSFLGRKLIAEQEEAYVARKRLSKHPRVRC
jgi:hypothetical protein